ncbi:restriction endonuclease subunit S [Vibrio sp. 1F279]|uniref:restriction endonuclease subunit S n=1 Tax=unclassified Vibrio TaxID=2614977 RepID=UPI00352ECBA6
MSWPLVNLSTICQIDMGSAPKGSTYVELDSGVPLIAGAADYGDVFPRPKKATLEPTKLCKKGDIIICVRATIGDLNWADKEYCLGRGVAGLRAHDEKLDSKYLWYFIASIEDELYRNSTGSTFPQINKKVIESLEIPLPPLKKQKQIAAALEKADQLRKDCQQMEQELNSLAQSVFIDMFGDPLTNPKGWDKRPLLELVADKDDIKCGPFGTQLGKSEFTTEGVPLWGIKHVNSGFEKPTVEYVSHEKALDLKAYSIAGGDIVMTRKGNVGNCYIYPDNLQSGIMHSDLLRIRPCNSTVSASFLQKQFMYSKDVEGQLKLISQGAIMAGINVTKLKSLMLLSPPLEEQKEYEKFLSEVETNKITLAHKLSESNNMFNALMQKAFKGELNL